MQPPNGWGEKCYEYITRFEELFKAHLGVKYAIATSSCTGALHMGMAALGIGPGDEVILADTNWIATAAAISILGPSRFLWTSYRIPGASTLSWQKPLSRLEQKPSSPCICTATSARCRICWPLEKGTVSRSSRTPQRPSARSITDSGPVPSGGSEHFPFTGPRPSPPARVACSSPTTQISTNMF